jgi:hypothetical protein
LIKVAVVIRAGAAGIRGHRLRRAPPDADTSKVPAEQMDTAMRAILGALADLNEGRVRTIGDLQGVVELLELAPYRDARAATEPARIARELAVELGDEQIQAQIQLIHADLLARGGQQEEAGRILFATSAWAKSSGNPHVLARSHYLMSMFYRAVGDLPSALENALYALESTPRRRCRSCGPSTCSPSHWPSTSRATRPRRPGATRKWWTSDCGSVTPGWRSTG